MNSVKIQFGGEQYELTSFAVAIGVAGAVLAYRRLRDNALPGHEGYRLGSLGVGECSVGFPGEGLAIRLALANGGHFKDSFCGRSGLAGEPAGR